MASRASRSWKTLVAASPNSSVKHLPNIKRKRIVILCGKGNNGGDGFVVARLLATLGATPAVFLAAAPHDLRGDAAANLAKWQNDAGHLVNVRNAEDWKLSNGPLASADIIVDALLGTGVRGPVEGFLAEIIQDVNRRRPAANRRRR